MMQNKKKHHLHKRAVCFILATLMVLSTALTGCSSITSHALEDTTDTSTVVTVSDETVSLRETLANSLDDSLAEQAAAISDDYWENDVPADEDAAFYEYANNENAINIPDIEIGASVDSDTLEATTVEKSYDENGLRETAFEVKVMYTTVDSDYLESSSITEMWNENYEAFIANYNIIQHLYEVKGYDDCYVAFVNFSALNGTEGEIVDADFTRGTNRNPVSMDDNIVLDKENGVIYVPKSWYFAGDGTELGLDLSAQIMVAVDVHSDDLTDDNGNFLANISVTVENESKADTVLRDGQYSMIAYDYVILPLFEAGKYADLSSDDIEVYINGSSEPVDVEDLAYNTETGELTVNHTAITISEVRVVLKKTSLLQAAANFFSIGDTKAATLAQSHSGMTCIYNVTTNEELNPDIDIDSLTVNDVLAYETLGNYGSRYGTVYQHMWTAGCNKFVYTSDFSAGTSRSDTYWTMVGNLTPDLSKMTYSAGKVDDYGFIIELPFHSSKKTSPYPVLIKSSSSKLTVGQGVYFGQQDDWKWTDEVYSSGTVMYNYAIPGQCSHTSDSTYLSGNMNFNPSPSTPVAGTAKKPYNSTIATSGNGWYTAADANGWYSSDAAGQNQVNTVTSNWNWGTITPEVTLTKDTNQNQTVTKKPYNSTVTSKTTDTSGNVWYPASEANGWYTVSTNGSQTDKVTSYWVWGTVTVKTTQTQSSDPTFRCYCDCAACKTYRQQSAIWGTLADYCDANCPTCSSGHCDECATDWIASATHINASATVRILVKTDEYMILGLAQLSSGDCQRGTSVIKVRTSVRLGVEKSAASDINGGTIDNSCYGDLADSTYAVYSDAACTDLVGTVKGDGVDYIRVRRGTYYIKETKAPVGYYLDTEDYGYGAGVHKVTIQKNTFFGKDVEQDDDGNYIFRDDPMDDPILLAVQKNVQDRDTAGVTTGDVGVLSGIEFTVSYFKGEYKSLESLPAIADESAVFATDKDGFLNLDDEHMVEGYSWKYRNEYGKMVYPLGTILIKEKSSIDGLLIYNANGMLYTITDQSVKTDYNTTSENYWGTIFTIIGSSNKELTADRVAGSYENGAYKGGVTVTKADLDWEKSDYQGDATLAGAEFTIYNASDTSVYYKGKIYEPGEAVTTITTSYVESAKAYIATTGTRALEYGTYTIKETKAPTGYNLADWERTFTIREDGQMHYYNRTNSEDTVNGLNWLHRWCADAVMRGGVAFGKVDRETKQYYSLGASSLAGATFALYNRSQHPVYVDGVTYAVNEKVMDFTAEEMTITIESGVEGYTKTIIGNTTGNYVLPYGTYEIVETGTGIGYLYDSNSKAQSKVFSIRSNGDMHYFTEEGDAFHNKVQREDWYFSKKADDSGREMVNVAWTVTSVTTGETHVIVTDENGKYQSNQVDHTQRTNANDPDSPISNGAIAIDEDGNYYVADSSKLDYDAGTWFTGINPDYTTWNEDGQSYTVDLGVKNVYGKSYTTTAIVDDTLRAYPYDTYLVQEISSDANEGYNLVSFLVTLKRYNSDPDSNGIILDYGTVDDQHVDIYTSLGYTATRFSNVVKYIPSEADVDITDVITYSGLTAGGEYTMKGEIHALDEDGNDLGIIATNEITFKAKAAGQLKMPFTVDTTEYYGNVLVATEAIYQKGTLLTEENDLTNTDQSVIVSDSEKEPEVAKAVEIDTYAVNAATNGKELAALTGQSIFECIKLENLQNNVSYKLEGSVYYVDENGNVRAVLDSEGNAVTASIENPTAEETMTFTDIDASELGGYDIVVYQTLYTRADSEDEWKVSAEHCDSTDADQMVHVPSVDTELLSSENIHNAIVGDKVVLTDKVDYTNLTVGQKYTVTGTLHTRNDNVTEDGVEVVDAGVIESVVGETTFTAEASNGSVNVTYTYDASDLEGKVVVAFEELYADTTTTEIPDDWSSFFAAKPQAQADGGRLVAVHKDIADTAQSVGFANIKATTLTTNSDAHEALASGDVVFTDVVEYEGLIPGISYDIKGTLNIKGATGDDAVVATVEEKFVPETINGTYNVAFAFNADDLDGKTVVAFETISCEGVELTVHADEDDEAQSVHFNGLDTLLVGVVADTSTATSDTTDTTTTSTTPIKTVKFRTYSGGQTVFGIGQLQADTFKLVDTVNYTNLTPGTEYTLVSEVHLRTQVGNQNVDNGNLGYNVTTTFTPEEADGSVDVVFTIAPIGIQEADITAFEYLYQGDTLVAQHADIDDDDQTVHVVGELQEDPIEGTAPEKNACGCDDPECKHKDEKDHCVNNPGCCSDSDCCSKCTTCKNACGCDDPNCKHKDEKDHCVNNPGCCSDSDCCDKCTTCKNLCGCYEKDCKHKNEKDYCVNNPGCCDDDSCCDSKSCTVCKAKTTTTTKNACGCDQADCKHKDEKDYCLNNPGCCDDDDCCKNCTTCKSKTTTTTTTKTETTSKNPVTNVIEAVKTGENSFLLVALLGLVILSGGGYVFFGKTEKGRKVAQKIREKFKK